MRREALQSSASQTPSPRRLFLPMEPGRVHSPPAPAQQGAIAPRTTSLSHAGNTAAGSRVGAFRYPEAHRAGSGSGGVAPSHARQGVVREGVGTSPARLVGWPVPTHRRMRCGSALRRIPQRLTVRSLCLRRFMMMVALFMRMKKPTPSTADKPGSSSSHSGNEPPPPAIQ